MTTNIPQKRRQAIEGLGLLVGITAFMWLIEGINSLDGQRLDSWGGIHARNIGDLWSVGTSWFLHANFSPHLSITRSRSCSWARSSRCTAPGDWRW